MSSLTETLPTHLVQTDWLATHLDAPDLRVFDCTVHLVPDPPRVYRLVSGRDDYDAGHILGAGFLDLIEELSDQGSELNFMMPDFDTFASAVGARGIGEGTSVVLYSTTLPMWDTRVWWMLRACGFERVAVLDGGFKKWLHEERPLSTEPCGYPPATFAGGSRAGYFVDKENVLAGLDDSSVVRVNALPPPLYRGEAETNYGRPGRIPASMNICYQELLDPESGLFLDAAKLRQQLEKPLAAEQVTAYCGGGISATVDAFALHMLGHDKVAVYDASMSEWATDPELPMESGPD